MVSHFLDLAFAVLKHLNQSDSSDGNLQHLVHEICRALGSLIYQNGSKLNEKNLQLLLGNRNQNKGILLVIFDQIEKQMNSAKEPINKLKLILTQLIFNLTMPVRILNSTSLGNIDTSNPPSYNTSFIEDKYKAACVYILIKMIRLQNLSLTPSVSTLSQVNKSASDEQIKEESSRLVIKALQSLENLFSSIELEKTQSSSIVHVDWLQAPSNEYQLGDILAIVKVRIKIFPYIHRHLFKKHIFDIERLYRFMVLKRGLLIVPFLMIQVQ